MTYLPRLYVATLVATSLVAAAADDAAAQANERSALTFSTSTIDNDYYADDYDNLDVSLSDSSEPTLAAVEQEMFTERYPNGNVKIEREVTLDGEGNYVNHGAWKMYNMAGKVIAEGQFDMGQRSGMWSRWHERSESAVFTQAPYNRFQAPFLSQARFTEGVLDGEWIIYDSNKQKCSLVSIRKGQRHGVAVVWTPGGKVLRQTSYDNGVPVGDVLQMNAQSGEVEKAATYIKGRQVVSKSTHHRRGGPKKTESQFLAPKTIVVAADNYWDVHFARYETEGEHLRHGPSKTWHANGQLQLEGQYEYDRRIGHFVYWHPNSQKAAEGEFVEDKHHGDWVWWHENGQKAAIGQYEDGALIGRWRWWDEDGKLAKQLTYDEPQSIANDDAPVETERVDVGEATPLDLRF